MPLDENFDLPKNQRQDYEVLPEDTYQVQILDIELRKDVPSFKDPNKKEDKLNFTFIIVEEGEFLKRRLWKEVRMNINPAFDGGSASWLYKIYSAANSVMLNEEECQAITTKDINNLIGKQLRLLVKQKQNTKGVLKNQIEDTLAVKKEIEFDASTVGKKSAKSDFEQEIDEQIKKNEEEKANSPVEDEDEINAEDIPI